MDLRSVFAAFTASAAVQPDAPFLIVPSSAAAGDASGPLTISYGDAATSVERHRRTYADAGLKSGDRVALLLENRSQMVAHFLALNALGVSIVPLNPDGTTDELTYLLEHSQACLLVVLPERFDGIAKVAARLGKPIPTVLGEWGAHRLQPLGGNRATGAGSAAPDCTTEAALLYTSGTTGRPKGCILTNHYFLTAGTTYAEAPGLVALRQGGERFYNPLPLYHMNHLAVTLTAALLTGNALVLTDRFSPQRWWPEIIETRATIVHYLGVIAALLMANPPSHQDRAHTVRLGVGAGIEPELHAAIEQRFGFPFVEVWGMTETGRVTFNAIEPRQIETRAFGRGFPGLELAVVDEQDQFLPADMPGELVVRASAAKPRDGFFSGYLKNADATEAAWRGGWFHTGDVVRIDPEGMATFIDRRKNIIRRAGENIAAAEVEATLQVHPAVRQVAVLAVKDEVREEEVLAAIVLEAGNTPDRAQAEALVGHARETLAYYKVPGFIVFLDTLPMTGTQKIQKGQIFPAGTDPRMSQGAIDLRSLKKR